MIADALFSLMKRKSFQQITVTEICEEAAVGRKTFYRNFELREDVIDFWLDLRCEECREVLLPVPTEEQLYHYCIFLKKYMDELIESYDDEAYNEEYFIKLYGKESIYVQVRLGLVHELVGNWLFENNTIKGPSTDA